MCSTAVNRGDIAGETADERSDSVKLKISKAAFLIFFAVVLALTVLPARADASSGVIQFTAGQPAVQIGSEFTIVCQVTSSTAFVDTEFTVEYDDTLMEFLEGGKKVSGGGGELQISSVGNSTETNKKTFSLQFRAKKSGSGLIYVKDRADITDADGNTFSVSSNRLSITVEKKAGKTPDAGKKDSGSQSSEKQDKDIQVTPAAQAASDAGVTPDAGMIPAEETDPPKKVKDKEDKNDVFGLQFSVSRDGSRVLLQNSYSFWVEDVDDSVQVPEGYEKTKIELDGITVPAYTAENDLDGNYLLMYLKSSSGNTGWYQYDREEKTLQRYTGNMVSRVNNGTASQGGIFSGETAGYIMFVIIVLLAIAVIALLSALLKRIIQEKEEEKEDEQE